MRTRPFIGFVHIEKTAGTTFTHLLRRNYFLRYLDVRPYSASSNGIFTARDLELSLRINPWLRVFGGHAIQPFGDLCDVFPNIRFVTIFRDPVKRYISQFLYGNTVLNLNVTFDQFLSDERTHNFQTRKIAGQANSELAMKILGERFLAFGLVEKFDHFLSKLALKLKPQPFKCAYEIRNVGSTATEEAKLLNSYEQQIRAVNQVDSELYQHVRSLWEADISDPAEDFHPDRRVRLRDRVKHYADGALRKVYYEPVTGLLRLRNGLAMKGSY